MSTCCFSFAIEPKHLRRAWKIPYFSLKLNCNFRGRRVCQFGCLCGAGILPAPCPQGRQVWTRWTKWTEWTPAPGSGDAGARQERCRGTCAEIFLLDHSSNCLKMWQNDRKGADFARQWSPFARGFDRFDCRAIESLTGKPEMTEFRSPNVGIRSPNVGKRSPNAGYRSPNGGHRSPILGFATEEKEKEQVWFSEFSVCSVADRAPQPGIFAAISRFLFFPRSPVPFLIHRSSFLIFPAPPGGSAPVKTTVLLI